MEKALWKSEQKAGKIMFQQRKQRYCLNCMRYKDDINFPKIKFEGTDQIVCTECIDRESNLRDRRNRIIEKISEM
ncbi:MAG: hypothetical protein DRN81_02000 [Thermoproteota archaeon]|nr:MAG: hypothetical protein DRN81_02000 [Candidatus Korarchaeota archaeon]